MVTPEEIENKIMKAEVDKAVAAMIPKLIEHIFAASAPETNMPPNEEQEEIPIYEKLSPGEVLIISRSKNGFLIASNDGKEFDIRYYSEE